LAYEQTIIYLQVLNKEQRIFCQEVRVKPGTFETRRSESCVDTHGNRTDRYSGLWRSVGMFITDVAKQHRDYESKKNAGK
jgi:hypothetical protein